MDVQSGSRWRPRITAIVVALLLLAPLLTSALANESNHAVSLPIVIAPPGVLLVHDEAGLRAAIEAANVANQMPRIELTADIQLSAPLPALDNPSGQGTITIAGNDHEIDGNVSGDNEAGIAPVLNIATGTRVMVEGTTITGGRQPMAESICGGAIFVTGHLVLRHSRVTDSWAGRGGGICVIGQGVAASLTLLDTFVARNNAGQGGGLYVLVEGGGLVSLDIVDSTLTSNRAYGSDGGGVSINASGGSTFTTIIRSTVSYNTAPGTAGLYNMGNQQGWDSGMEAGYAWVDIYNSTFSGNVSQGYGGAIGNFSYPPWEPVTPGNAPSQSITPLPPALGFGHVEVFNSTITGNWAYRGSGIFNYTDAFLSTTGTVIAGNEPGGDDCWRPIVSGGYNLDGDETCGLGGENDVSGGYPDLRPLALWPPGNTPTHPLGPDSQALDRIPVGGPGCDEATDTDQRGVSRPQPAGGLCDIGSYEANGGQP